LTWARTDAAARGSKAGRSVLDETLIVCTSEFGRTPDMNPVAGRDHYKGIYTTMFLGGGIVGGRIIRRTDRDGAH
jgi:uncharacterized protein (DUF1501 family)